MAIHTLAQWDHRGRVERGEVGQPAPKDRVVLLCEVIQRQSGASLQPPGHCLATDIGQLLRGHGRQEPREVLLPFLVEEGGSGGGSTSDWNAARNGRGHGYAGSGNGLPICSRTGRCDTRPEDWTARAG